MSVTRTPFHVHRLNRKSKRTILWKDAVRPKYRNSSDRTSISETSQSLLFSTSSHLSLTWIDPRRPFMNVHLETMLKLNSRQRWKPKTERSVSLIFRPKRLCSTEPRKVYILVREFIGEYPLRLLFRAEFYRPRILNRRWWRSINCRWCVSASRTNSALSEECLCRSRWIWGYSSNAASKLVVSLRVYFELITDFACRSDNTRGNVGVWSP
jgi:hypothetical protein